MARHSDPWQDPSAKRWVRQVLEGMAAKMAHSAVVCSVVPDGDGDVKFWVELGASIMMDKPIIAVVLGDRAIPTKLEAIADEIVRCPEGVNPAASEDVAQAVARIMERL
jgi:hypothetical protein